MSIHWECFSLLCIPHRVWLSGISTEEAVCFVHGGEEGPSTWSAGGVPGVAWKLNRVQSCPHYVHLGVSGAPEGLFSHFPDSPKKVSSASKTDFFPAWIELVRNPHTLGAGPGAVCCRCTLISFTLGILSLCYVK